MKRRTINLKQLRALRRKRQSRRSCNKKETTLKKNTFFRGTVRRLTMDNTKFIGGK